MTTLNLRIRTATEQDITSLHQVFEASVRHTCNQHYTEAQINAWVAKADISRWQELFNSDLVFMLAEDCKAHQMAGFTSINAEGYLHSMFVHPDYQHKGIAQQLLNNAEQFAIKNQVSEIHVEASITARPFFEKAGYIVEKEQTVVVNGTEMTNFVMQKQHPIHTPEIRTERLLLRPFQESDLQDSFDCCHNPNLGNNAGWKPHDTLGLMGEAVQAVLTYGFKTLALDLITATYYPFNLRSQHVLERYGFICEGTLHQAEQIYTGEVYNHLCYYLDSNHYKQK